MVNIAHRGLFCCVPLILAAAFARMPALQTPADEQETLHILLVADTSDDSIGKSCITDLKTVKRYFAEATNIPKNRQVRLTFMTGSPAPDAAQGALIYSRDAILAHYKGLADRGDVKPGDTILFYYSGHGAFDPEKGHFLAKMGDLEHSMFRSDLRQAILQCKPRLTVLLTDCCSNVISLASILSKGLVEDRARVVDSLFFKPSGVVDINSSSQGQESAGTESEGGFFTSVFFDKMGLEVDTIEKRLAAKGLPVKMDGILTWRELFPLLTVPTSLKWKTAFPGPDCKDNDTLPDGKQCSQDPQAFCLPNSPLLDPPASFKHGLTIEAAKKDGKDVVIIRMVDMDSAADKGGLKPGDLISSIDGKKVSNACEFDCAMGFSPDPTRVAVIFIRDSKSNDCILKLDHVN
jgi:hypothetical protein